MLLRVDWHQRQLRLRNCFCRANGREIIGGDSLTFQQQLSAGVQIRSPRGQDIFRAHKSVLEQVTHGHVNLTGGDLRGVSWRPVGAPRKDSGAGT